MLNLYIFWDIHLSILIIIIIKEKLYKLKKEKIIIPLKYEEYIKFTWFFYSKRLKDGFLSTINSIKYGIIGIIHGEMLAFHS